MNTATPVTPPTTPPITAPEEEEEEEGEEGEEEEPSESFGVGVELGSGPVVVKESPVQQRRNCGHFFADPVMI